ncbi:MAG: YraN family protein [Patescibacteria group bacterium]|nr:YraN family protein [Patescibacteria group bacterium]
MNAKEIGNLGEKIAERYLRGKGFEILTNQYHASKLGEIDIIAEKNKHLHFIEVKTRTSRVFGSSSQVSWRKIWEDKPEDAITYSKQQKIKMSINYFLMKHNIGHDDFQVDCIAVELDYKTRKAKIRYLEYII